MQKNAQKRRGKHTYIDPEFKLEHLDDLSRKVLNIEVANAGITSAGIIRIIEKNLGKKIDPRRIYRIRKDPNYQYLLSKRRKNELEVFKDAQLQAVLVLQQALLSTDEKVRVNAAKYILSPTRDLTVEEGKMRMQVEAAKLVREDQQEVILTTIDDSIPILGQSTVTAEGFVRRKNPATYSATEGPNPPNTIETLEPSPIIGPKLTQSAEDAEDCASDDIE